MPATTWSRPSCLPLIPSYQALVKSLITKSFVRQIRHPGIEGEHGLTERVFEQAEALRGRVEDQVAEGEDGLGSGCAQIELVAEIERNSLQAWQ